MQKPKRAIFPSLLWGGGGKEGRGVSNFPSILSKIAILDRIKWNSKPPSPQSKDEAAQKPKRAIFPSLIWGGGGLQISHLFCPRLKLQSLEKEYVELKNKGAKENGWEDVGAYWRSWYEVDDLEIKVEGFWIPT